MKWNEKGWTLQRKVEALRLMDAKIRDCGDAYGRASIWHDYGGGLRKTAEETQSWLEYTSSDDTRFANALFCFMVCMTADFSWLKIK